MYLLDRSNMGHFRSGNNGQILQSFQASSAGRMNGSPVYLEQPDLWTRDVSLGGGRSAQGVPSCRRTVSDAGRRPGNGARAQRDARRHAVALGQRQRTRHGHSVGGAVTRRRCQPCPAAGNPARVRREQRDARAVEQPAERHAGHARKLFEVQPADRRERKGVRAEPVEQAGRVRPDWPVRRQQRAGRQRRRRSEPCGAWHGHAHRNRHRRRQPDHARPAHDDVEPGERSGGRHLRRAECAVDRGLTHRPRRLYDPAQRVRWRSDQHRRRGRHGRPAGGIRHRAPRAVFQRCRKRHLLHGAGADTHRSDGRFRLGRPRAGSAGTVRQLLRPLERTGDGAGHGHLHVHHHVRRRRASLSERAAADRQLDGSSGRTEQRDGGAAGGSAVRHPDGLLRPRDPRDRQAVVGVPRPGHPDRAAVGVVSRASRQSASRRERGRRSDDQSPGHRDR